MAQATPAKPTASAAGVQVPDSILASIIGLRGQLAAHGMDLQHVKVAMKEDGRLLELKPIVAVDVEPAAQSATLAGMPLEIKNIIAGHAFNFMSIPPVGPHGQIYHCYGLNRFSMRGELHIYFMTLERFIALGEGVNPTVEMDFVPDQDLCAPMLIDKDFEVEAKKALLDTPSNKHVLSNERVLTRGGGLVGHCNRFWDDNDFFFPGGSKDVYWFLRANDYRATHIKRFTLAYEHSQTQTKTSALWFDACRLLAMAKNTYTIPFLLVHPPAANQPPRKFLGVIAFRQAPFGHESGKERMQLRPWYGPGSTDPNFQVPPEHSADDATKKRFPYGGTNAPLECFSLDNDEWKYIQYDEKWATEWAADIQRLAQGQARGGLKTSPLRRSTERGFNDGFP